MSKPSRVWGRMQTSPSRFEVCSREFRFRFGSVLAWSKMVEGGAKVKVGVCAMVSLGLVPIVLSSWQVLARVEHVGKACLILRSAGAQARCQCKGHVCWYSGRQREGERKSCVCVCVCVCGFALHVSTETCSRASALNRGRYRLAFCFGGNPFMLSLWLCDWLLQCSLASNPTEPTLIQR